MWKVKNIKNYPIGSFLLRSGKEVSAGAYGYSKELLDEDDIKDSSIQSMLVSKQIILTEVKKTVSIEAAPPVKMKKPRKPRKPKPAGVKRKKRQEGSLLPASE